MMDSCVRKSLGGPCKYLDSAWSGIPGRISKIFRPSEAEETSIHRLGPVQQIQVNRGMP